MSDVPDDLTSVGRHHGNDPPTETGQEVRSPSGPDPASAPADPSPALFQLVRDANDRLQIRVHSPQAEISPQEEDSEELGQYRTVDALRDALAETDIAAHTAVFEDAETDSLITDSDVSSDHAWIGQPRYEVITFFASEDAAAEFVQGADRSTDSA